MDFHQSKSDDSISSDGSVTSEPNDAPVVDNDYNNANSEVRNVTRGDDRGVFLLRMVVKITMIAIAIALTAVTYAQLKRWETEEYRSAFDSYSKLMLAFAHDGLVAQSEALEDMTDMLETYAQTIETTDEVPPWPYVTLPFHQFEHNARQVTSFSFDGILWIAPLVTDVTAWDKYCSDVMINGTVQMSSQMFSIDNKGAAERVSGTGPFAPLHEVYPSPNFVLSINSSIVNYNILSDPLVNYSTTLAHQYDLVVISGLLSVPFIREAYPEKIDAMEPVSVMIEPIYSTFEESSDTVGYVQLMFQWLSFFSKFKGDRHSILCTLENTCGDFLTVEIDGPTVTLVDAEYSKKVRMNDISASRIIGIDEDDISVDEALNAGICVYTLTVFPTIKFRESYNLRVALFASIIGLAMFIMVASFFAYDFVVKRRNDKLIKTAVQSTAIVTSLFPSNVRDRLYKEQEEIAQQQKNHRNLKAFLHEKPDGSLGSDATALTSKPLADLFPEATVLFADIAGFTAWSSVREPCQVFILLETLFAAFDAIAKRRRIFKIETVGDCYVAVSGVPEPMADHAIAMCKFANDILTIMRKLTRQMETTLGPDTGDLSLRIGLHSGPVTAGVLRGERARFQLFGDTMNTAARMEQTGIKNRIQVSQSTADCLHARGKSHWLRSRDDKVVAKGKGELVTYWLEVKSESSGEKSSRASEKGNERVSNSVDLDFNDRQRDESVLLSEKTSRLVDWNTDILKRLLKQIVAFRIGTVSESSKKVVREKSHPMHSSDDNSSDAAADELLSIPTFSKPFEEVKELIELPHIKKMQSNMNDNTVTLSTEICDQLRNYVSRIAEMYKRNAFHNFEHASHVTMSVTKLLSRLVSPSSDLNTDDETLTATLHDHTYGIASDPLTQFACVFSTLIHDVDHAGVPNTQLVKENEELAQRYDGKSVAEQNSIDIAWGLLMTTEFKELRQAICPTKSELARFRQLVVNAVMATDIMDKDLKNIRNTRWTKAFDNVTSEVSQEAALSEQERMDQMNRKATIVIEHIIQASDVSHTMQHWHVYRKWNEFFYFECYDAFVKGRSLEDPAETWYQGELNFFDYYIIPLAKKLNECGVFGVSGAEYLQYAMSNRMEWEARGQQCVTDMRARAIEKYSK